MAELGRIEASRKAACPHCGFIIDYITEEEISEDGTVGCMGCGQPVGLPADVIARLKEKSYLGTGIDISC